ncbi:MAG TPA: porin [Pirellulales bacterium]|jgi:hypothetical protein
MNSVAWKLGVSLAAVVVLAAATAQADDAPDQTTSARPTSAPSTSTQSATTQSAPAQLLPTRSTSAQRPVAIDYSDDHGYGAATSGDLGQQYYLRAADANPSWLIRQRGMASGYSAPQSMPSFSYAPRQQSVGGQYYNGQYNSGSQYNNGQYNTQQYYGPSEGAAPRDSYPSTRRVPARFVSADGEDETMPPSVPTPPGMGRSNSSGAPPMPYQYRGNSGSMGSGNSGGMPMGSGSSENNSSSGDSCGCNSCGCDSCNGDCCHKIQPLVQIDECCPLDCCDDPTDHLFDNCCWLKCNDMTLTGWVNAGIAGNSRASDDHFNGPTTFDDRRGEGQANQQWISLDRSAPKDNCGWFIGGHVDYFFGSDYFFTTAAGLDGTPTGNVPRWNTTDSSLYGFAMPQLYVETDYGDDFKIKWGHFFTIIGYEVVPAVGNFFYSHSYTMQYGEPFTHTGFLASETHCNWTYYGGLVAGWNTFDTNDRATFLGGVAYNDKDYGSLAFSIITGDDSEANLPGVAPFGSRTMYSLVWSRNFTSRFTYVLQHDLGEQNQAQTANGGGAQWYGINQYMFYKLNCQWSAGLRIEWFRDDDGFVVTGLRPGNAIAGASFPGNFYECTLGLNYKPNGNLAIRPEIRWDWYDGQNNQNQNVPVTLPFDAGTRSNQFTYAVDLVYQF